MNKSTKIISPLRRRMIDDMRLRKLLPKTQSAYIRAVKTLARFLGRFPKTASAEDLRLLQLRMVEQGVTRTTLNATLTGLRFLFEITLERPQVMKKTSHFHQPRKLPVVLSPEEVARLLEATLGLKYQAALSVAYGAGLRASEVVALKVTDIDSTRMMLRVEQGNGGKDRYAMLSPVLLKQLRQWWRAGHAQGKMLKGGWLFPGQDPLDPMSTRQLNGACHDAVRAAGIDTARGHRSIPQHPLYLPRLRGDHDHR